MQYATPKMARDTGADNFIRKPIRNKAQYRTHYQKANHEKNYTMPEFNGTVPATIFSERRN